MSTSGAIQSLYLQHKEVGVVGENMNRAGRRFGNLGSFGALKFLQFLVSFLCVRANSIAGYLSKSMGVASLNTKTMLSMCFYLCLIFSLSFSFSFSFSVTTSSTSGG